MKKKKKKQQNGENKEAAVVYQELSHEESFSFAYHTSLDKRYSTKTRRAIPLNRTAPFLVAQFNVLETTRLES